MTVAELEKHRTAVREKMNKNQAKLKVEPAKVKAHKAHDISEFKTGMHVRVLTMNVIGTVSAIHPTKKQVTVQVYQLRLIFSAAQWTRLLPVLTNILTMLTLPRFRRCVSFMVKEPVH